MIDRPQWLIQVPNDLKYFPVATALLFESNKLGNFAQAVRKEYRLDREIVTPKDIAGFEIYFDSREHERDLSLTMIRLGFTAQVINYLISHGIERYIREPENAGHGYAVTVINSHNLCSDIVIEAHGIASLIDIENRAGYYGNPLFRVNIYNKGFLAKEGSIFKFNADKEGRGKEGIFLAR